MSTIQENTPAFARAHDDWLTPPSDRIGHWQARELVDDVYDRQIIECLTLHQLAKADDEILNNEGMDFIDAIESAKPAELLTVAKAWQKKIRSLRAEYANRLRDRGELDVTILYPTND